MTYICPICAGNLSLAQTSWQCPKGHQFDRAKEGYVNLLPVQKKKSKDPGDNKAMMMARREFLNQGFYQKLSDRVNDFALDKVKGLSDLAVLDIGCGEGYYSQRLYQHLGSAHEQIDLFGLDISKSAIRYAAKRYAHLNFSVASVFEMPYADKSFDLAIRIYAPSKPQELHRVMKDEGYLVTVSPGPKHHYALKQVIYDYPKLHSNEALQIDGFEHIHQECLSYDIELKDKKDIDNFLNMTPYAWKLSDYQKQKLSEQDFKCELDFKIEIYRKKSL
ncbi:23S rRNA (guanine(745)-N(1))-methyltransferase [Shewanella maritima]|uniref:23S rRNA (guanine(745)-N(1))-methyltransferase n=1 Tax=Shewanella maritima TaxID=2520507 RepID=UPI003736C879